MPESVISQPTCSRTDRASASSTAPRRMVHPHRFGACLLLHIMAIPIRGSPRPMLSSLDYLHPMLSSRHTCRSNCGHDICKNTGSNDS